MDQKKRIFICERNLYNKSKSIFSYTSSCFHSVLLIFKHKHKGIVEMLILFDLLHTCLLKLAIFPLTNV